MYGVAIVLVQMNAISEKGTKYYCFPTPSPVD